MTEPSAARIASAVARLLTDAPTAFRIQDALAEGLDSETTAISISEEPDGRWSVAVHFRDRPDEAAVRARIAAMPGTAAAQALVFELLEPTDWVRKSLEGLQPVEAGRFVVHGAHHRAHVRANRIGIQIEAALAFGTGHHGSTLACLLALDRIAKEWSTRRQRHTGCLKARSRRARVRLAGILDVGTGTGVLAIAAAKALRRPVLASDSDARAVAVARGNMRINRVAAGVEVLHAAGLGAHRFRERSPFALILANILLDPLQQLAMPMARLVAPNGIIVLSGLLTSQARTALACYCARGFVLVQRITLEGWTTLVLARPARRRP